MPHCPVGSPQTLGVVLCFLGVIHANIGAGRCTARSCSQRLRILRNGLALISIHPAGKGSAGSVSEVRIETCYGDENVIYRVWISWMLREGPTIYGGLTAGAAVMKRKKRKGE